MTLDAPADPRPRLPTGGAAWRAPGPGTNTEGARFSGASAAPGRVTSRPRARGWRRGGSRGSGEGGYERRVGGAPMEPALRRTGTGHLGARPAPPGPGEADTGQGARGRARRQRRLQYPPRVPRGRRRRGKPRS